MLQTLFRRKMLVASLTLGLAAPLVYSSVHAAPLKAPPAPPIANCHIHAMNVLRGTDEKGRFLRISTFVTLFKEGQMLRSTDLYNSPNSASGYVDFNDLFPGKYEVHFQTKGYGTVIKKVTLSPDQVVNVALESVSQNDEVWDGGPTVYEMEKHIAALEKKNQELEARLEALEKK